jgi:hypothetical protein
MNLKKLGSRIHYELVEEMKSIKSRYESDFPYHIIDKEWSGSHENNYEASYMIAWSLDKHGDEIISKVHYKFLPDTFHEKIMIEAQFRRSHIAEHNRGKRQKKHDWLFSDCEDWKYEKNFVVEANVITLMMLLGMNSNDCHDIIVAEVLEA